MQQSRLVVTNNDYVEAIVAQKQVKEKIGNVIFHYSVNYLSDRVAGRRRVKPWTFTTI